MKARWAGSCTGSCEGVGDGGLVERLFEAVEVVWSDEALVLEAADGDGG